MVRKESGHDSGRGRSDQRRSRNQADLTRAETNLDQVGSERHADQAIGKCAQGSGFNQATGNDALGPVHSCEHAGR